MAPRTLSPRFRPAALGLLAVVVAAAVIWYVGPWSREFRYARSDLLALDAKTAREPEDGLAHYYLGRRLLEKGAPDQALPALRRAVILRPQDVRARTALGQALLEQNETDEAFQVLKAAEAAAPRSAEPKVLLARLYQRRGAHLRAEELWRDVTRLAPQRADAWFGLGTCHLQLQHLDQATAATERGLALSPRDLRGLRLRGSIAAAKGDLSTARDYFERGVRFHPGEARAHHDLANFLLTQSRSPADIGRAEEAVNAVARLQPDYALLPWHRGRIALLRQQWEPAVRELEAALRVEPGLDEAWFHLASAYHRTGQRSKGDSAMRTFRSRSERTRRMDEIRIRMGQSEDPQLRFRLARLRREAGQLAEARRAAEDGLRLAPGDKEGLAELRAIDQALARIAGTP